MSCHHSNTFLTTWQLSATWYTITPTCLSSQSSSLWLTRSY